jgi:hypothetical protein
MPPNNSDELLHDIDKRLAVLEVLQREHSEHMEDRLDKIERHLDKLRLRVAGIATAVAGVVAGAAKYLGG